MESLDLRLTSCVSACVALRCADGIDGTGACRNLRGQTAAKMHQQCHHLALQLAFRPHGASPTSASLAALVRACVRACVRARARRRVHASVHVCVHACMCVLVCACACRHKSASYNHPLHSCAGHYKSSYQQGAWCEECELGSFAPRAGMTQCSSCPATTSTAVRGASSYDDCQCEKGRGLACICPLLPPLRLVLPPLGGGSVVGGVGIGVWHTAARYRPSHTIRRVWVCARVRIGCLAYVRASLTRIHPIARTAPLQPTRKPLPTSPHVCSAPWGFTRTTLETRSAPAARTTQTPLSSLKGRAGAPSLCPSVCAWLGTQQARAQVLAAHHRQV